MTAGDFKWNIELSNWSFCGVDVECKQGQTQQVGAGVEVTMEMKGSGDAIESSNGRKVDLGGGVEVFVSKMLYCDDQWIPMESGYPLFRVQGSKQLWTMRFPIFNSTCTYDPLLNTGAVLAEEADDETSGAFEFATRQCYLLTFLVTLLHLALQR